MITLVICQISPAETLCQSSFKMYLLTTVTTINHVTADL